MDDADRPPAELAENLVATERVHLRGKCLAGVHGCQASASLPRLPDVQFRAARSTAIIPVARDAYWPRGAAKNSCIMNSSSPALSLGRADSVTSRPNRVEIQTKSTSSRSRMLALL